MMQEEIGALLERYAAAKNRHDIDSIIDLCREDAYYENVATGQPIHGKERLREFYTALFEGLPDYYGDFDGVAYGDNTSVSWGRFGGTSSGQINGIPVEKGRKIEIPVVFICQWREGKLLSDRGYFDLVTFLDQAGLGPGAISQQTSEVESDGSDPEAFVAGLKRVWAGELDLVPELIAPEASMKWPGLPAVRGSEYPQFLRAMAGLIPDLTLKVMESASVNDALFISWKATGTIGEECLEWAGIDRFRLRDGQAVEGLIAFDPGPLRAAMERAGISVTPQTPADA